MDSYFSKPVDDEIEELSGNLATVSGKLINAYEYSNYYRFDDPTSGICFGINPVANRMFLNDGHGNTYYFNLTRMT